MTSDLSLDPDMSHAGSGDWQRVYEPAEDTFLLMDGLARAKVFIEAAHEAPAASGDEQSEEKLTGTEPSERKSAETKPLLMCLEVGAGSGMVISYVGKLFGVDRTVCLATDINPDAAELAQRTMTRNGVVGGLVLTDLVDACFDRIAGQLVTASIDPSCNNDTTVV
eukprot:TRINITY_DN69748_c0_g1_i1.p2 TRINITY_DN69748_c0_g1~~TRINITY_DN69748_c0_g1_i1.p2  ORF type:complete len:166 (-),score=43.36 TRINITY_DN69748_c0_g1_i1:350-847(-)